MAYKKDTHSTKNSTSIALLEAIPDYYVRVFDPVVPSSTVTNKYCFNSDSELDACTGADALIIMTPWHQFSKISPKEIAKKMKGNKIFDPYKILNSEECRNAGLKYFTLGVSNDTKS